MDFDRDEGITEEERWFDDADYESSIRRFENPVDDAEDLFQLAIDLVRESQENLHYQFREFCFTAKQIVFQPRRGLFWSLDTARALVACGGENCLLFVRQLKAIKAAVSLIFASYY